MTLIAFTGLLVVITALVFKRDGFEGVREGVMLTVRMLRRVGPMIVLGVALAGMTEVILPSDLIARWMGGNSGIVGISIGAAVGSLVPAGPYVVMPLLGSMMAAGAGVGPAAAFMTAWSVTPISRTLVWELPFLGGRFTASRMAVSLPFPFLAGFMTPYVFRLID